MTLVDPTDKLRHPEKAHKPDNPIQRKPAWIRVKAPMSQEYNETRALMRGLKLNTVCEEAACPNIGECWKQKHATFMILGSICTRGCAFCNVETGRPDRLDPHEPEKVAEAVGQLKLHHVVITSVDRDDLDDGGADHFARTIRAIRAASPETTIEILTPDFQKKKGRSRPSSNPSPTCSITTWKPRRACTRRSVRVPAISPPCNCWQRSSSSIRRSSPNPV